jgi:hypothetical protein
MIALPARILDPRDLILSVFLWALLIPAALLAFVGAEITERDWVDGVNALIYAFAALLATALARQAGARIEGSADPFGRAFWIAAALFCLAFVASELAGDVIERLETELRPIWIGDLVCWVAAGGFVLAVVRSELHGRRPAPQSLPPVARLLVIAFALNSIGLGVDIAEPVMGHRFGLDAATYDNLSDLLEFAYLQIYLLGFILLAAGISARHAMWVQVAAAESMTEPAAILRAAHVAFTTAAFVSPRFSRRRLHRALRGLALRSGFGGIAAGLVMTRRLGPSIRRRTGKSDIRQFAEQMGFMWRFGLSPNAYYLFELFKPEHARVAGQYLQRGETKGAAYRIMRRSTGQRLSEKLCFHDRCAALGLPVAPVVFAAAGGAADAAYAGATELPGVDLFVKPRKGSGGRGAAKWRFAGGMFIHADGSRMSPAALREKLVAQSRSMPLLVQKVLVNHSALAEIACGTLATIRIVTCRNEKGCFEVTNAAFRMPRVAGSTVDNFHAGGIAAAVDIVTGRLGPATDLGRSPDSGWFTTHPVTGAAIEGRLLPFWHEARDLVERAHAHFDDFAVIGWDIAILEDGPAIVEANGAPDLDIIQRTSRQPLGNARLGRLMAWHVKRGLRRALLDEE